MVFIYTKHLSTELFLILSFIFWFVISVFIYWYFCDRSIYRTYKTTFDNVLADIDTNYPLMVIYDNKIFFTNGEQEFHKFVFYIKTKNMRITDELWILNKQLFLNVYLYFQYKKFINYIIEHDNYFYLKDGKFTALDDVKKYIKNKQDEER